MNNHLKICSTCLLGIIVLSLIMTSCGGDNSSENTPTAVVLSNADILKLAINNMKAAKSYHLDANINSNGQPIRLVGDIDFANKNEELSVSVGALYDIQVIIIGRDPYISTDGGNNFTKSDQATSIASNMDPFISIWSKVDTADVDKNKDNLKDGIPATEIIDGISSKHITASTQDLPSLHVGVSGITFEGTIDLWVAQDQSSVTQIKAMGKAADQEISTMMKWSNINGVAEIRTPIISK